MMPRRPALITQADIARAIRAMHVAGYDRVRVRLTGDSVIVEAMPPAESRGPQTTQDDEPEKVIVV